MTATKTLLPDAREHSQPNTRVAWLHGITLACIVALASVLSFHWLGAKSLWFDEGFSVGLVRLPWRVFLHVLWWREGNMTLYYLLLRGWMHFGQSEAWIRTLSLIFSVATLPAVYFLARRLFDSRTGLTAAALLAVNAFQVAYAQEARSYSLLTFLCALSSLYFVKAMEKPSRLHRRMYVAASALAVYAHFFALLLIAAQWLSLRFLDTASEAHPSEFRRKKDWRWILAFVAPVIIFIAKTGAGPLRWLTRPGLTDLWDFLLLMTGSGGWLLVLVYAVAVGAAIFPALTKFSPKMSWERWRVVFLLGWAFFPPILILAASFARPMFYPRYFIFCVPALAMLAAAGLRRIRYAPILAVVLAAFLFLGLRGTAAYYRAEPWRETESWRAATEYVLQNARPDDGIIFWIPAGRLPYGYYAGRASAHEIEPATIFPGSPGQMSFEDFSRKPDYGELARALDKHGRVWLVLSNAWGKNGTETIPTQLEGFLQATYLNVASRNFGDRRLGDPEIRLYSRK